FTGCKTLVVFKVSWFCHSSYVLKEVLRTITSRINKTMWFLENVVFYKELAKDGNFGAIYELAECYVHAFSITKLKILQKKKKDNSSQSSQEFLPLDYSQDELQEDLINVEDMISSDNEKEHDNDPVFDLEQSLYEYTLASAEFSAEDIPILQEISNEETGDEYTEEIPAIMTKQTTLCIIIDNNHGEIRRCNRESAKGLRELISVWEIDEDAVNDVNKELHHKADPGCTAMHLDDTETTLLHFAKLIKIVAYSENDIIKKNLLQDLIPCIENFNLDSSSASSSKLPSLFVVNTILKIKKIDFSKQQLIQKPKKYEEFGKSLALKVLKSRTSLAPYKSTLESPDSLQQYYEAIPKCLTSLFDSLIHTLLFQKYEIVRQKQKECKSTITKFDESEIVKSTVFLSSIILTTTFKGWKFWLPQVIESFCK
ncbi:8102_t:CDS:2, partial [Dentiscutata erythropus]